MIPKIIHYCWFGGKPLPQSVQKAIESWKKFLPDFEIKRWDENNIDLNKCDYLKEAYEARKYAFMSDYVRFDVLYKYGGLYFDTDVELIKPIYDLIEKGPFMGLEKGTIQGLKRMQNGMFNFSHRIAPGLGLGAEPNMPIYKTIVEYYESMHFRKPNGSLNQTTTCLITTKLLTKKAVVIKDNYAIAEGVCIYPKDYFCPLNYLTRGLKITPNTRSIHWYDSSWFPKPIIKFLKKLAKKKNPEYFKD